MAYDIKWFEKNMHAELAPVLGACSFCCFRNLDKDLFCSKLTCYDERTDNYVYWEANFPELNRELLMGLVPNDMCEWFNKTPNIEHVSASMICIGRQR